MSDATGQSVTHGDNTRKRNGVSLSCVVRSTVLSQTTCMCVLNCYAFFLGSLSTLILLNIFLSCIFLFF